MSIPRATEEEKDKYVYNNPEMHRDSLLKKAGKAMTVVGGSALGGTAASIVGAETILSILGVSVTVAAGPAAIVGGAALGALSGLGVYKLTAIGISDALKIREIMKKFKKIKKYPDE